MLRYTAVLAGTWPGTMPCGHFPMLIELEENTGTLFG